MKRKIYLFLVLISFTLAHSDEYGVVEDFEHVEPENYRTTHLFEDFNYELYDRQVFLRKIHKDFRGLISHYQKSLKQILSNKELNDKNCGPMLSKLFGEDFAYFNEDIKRLEIKLKAYVEKEINMFFLYKCNNRFFHDRQMLPLCDVLKLKTRNYLMFKNFFGFGYLNEVQSYLAEADFGDAFNEAYLNKVEDLYMNFRQPMTLIWFTRDQLKATIVRMISKRFGKGLKISVLLVSPDGEGSDSQESLNEVPDDFKK